MDNCTLEAFSGDDNNYNSKYISNTDIKKLMKLEGFVTMVFDLKHKFVGQNVLSKVF